MRKALVLTGLASTTVYNTLQSTDRSRAALVISSKILPALKKLEPLFDIPDFKYIGLMAVYASKNFVNRSDVLNLEAETVSLIAPTALASQFAKGDLTEDELVAASDVFLVDRNGPRDQENNGSISVSPSAEFGYGRQQNPGRLTIYSSGLRRQCGSFQVRPNFHS